MLTSGHYFEPVTIMNGEAGLVATKVTGWIRIWVMKIAQVFYPRHFRTGLELILQH